MKISRIEVNNFRSLKRIDLEVPQICALVGPNNSGKSNIMAAVERVLGSRWLSVNSFEEEDVFGRDPNADISIKVTFDPPLLHKKYVADMGVKVSTFSFEFTRYKIGEGKGERRLEQKCYGPNGKAPMVPSKAPKKGEQQSFQPLVNIPSDLRETVPLIFIGTSRAIKDQLPSVRNSLLRQLLEDVNRDFNDPSQTIEITRGGKKETVVRAEYFGSLMERVLVVLRTSQFDELERSIKSNALRQLGFDPETEEDRLDFYFAPFESMDFYRLLELRVREFGTSVQATELGEGFQNALVLSILQAFEERKKKGAIILIEEPEIFLHPQMQRSLYKTIRQIGKTNQVIYTTHSPHFVSIPEYDEVLITRKGAEGTKARKSRLLATEKRREKFLKELDPERSELFFASRLLLVEGDTEKLALPEYAKRLGYDLDRSGATIVEVGGKRNLPDFLDLAESFQIPVGVLYDVDSSDFRGKSEDEKIFNEALDLRAKADGSVRIWRLSKNYEDHLRAAVEESVYQALCQKFPLPKPSRARLIAQEELPIPEPVPEILRWLVA